MISSQQIFYLVLMIPLAGSLLPWVIQKEKYAVYGQVLSVIISLVLSFCLLISLGTGDISHRFQWLPGLELGWYLDPVSISLITLVLFVSLMIHLFSLHYMDRDPGKRRYFSILGFFTFSMLGLLAADHLILLFLFWELVGFSSYLLIGFWFTHTENAQAARIGFITNRVADVLLLSGILVIWANLGHGWISELHLETQEKWMFLAGLGIVSGAFGKSAQFPFYTWLPRAMAGPTPVSALIHAATMVAAGVYLLVRLQDFFIPDIRMIIVFAGVVTMIIGALSAISQSDIKKVLAFSTISQLGYMVMAVGVGAREMALFHLWTHAFFKAGLFLCVGAIIHQIHIRNPSVDAQDMRLMGGLRKAMPVTFWVYLVCMFSLAGLPMFSGFISKEGIIISAFHWAGTVGTLGYIVAILGIAGVFITAFYMARQAIWVFLGTYRGGVSLERWTEPMAFVKAPLILLALGSFWIAYALNPFSHDSLLVSYWFPSFPGHISTSGGVISVVSVGLAVLGLIVANRLFSKKEAAILTFNAASLPDKISFQAFFLDHIYIKYLVPVVDRLSWISMKMDNRVIDPIIDWIGMGFVVLSKLVDLLDKLVVDNIVSFTAWISATTGDIIRLAHSRRVQLHIVWALLGMIMILIWVHNFGLR